MRNSIVTTRIKHLLALTLVMLMVFTIRLVDIQAVRAANIAKKVTNELDRKSTRLNSSHIPLSRMPSSA